MRRLVNELPEGVPANLKYYVARAKFTPEEVDFDKIAVVES